MDFLSADSVLSESSVKGLGTIYTRVQNCNKSEL